MESRFGHDFSGVRVHTGRQAEVATGALDADAYTVGQDLVFAAGRYAPHTEAGRRLLAHELTHVVQQREAGTAAVQCQSAPAVPQTSTDRVDALVSRFHAARDEDERLSIARQVLVEVDRILADTATDPQLRKVLGREASTLREQLDRASQSPLRKAGVAAGGTVLVGGGPEDPVGDIAAVIVFVGVLAAAYTSSRTRVDPGQVSDALDRIRKGLPQRQQEPERKPPRPLGPDGPPPPVPSPPLHQGNIHVQGDDVPNPPNFAWSQPVPATKVQGLAGLASVRSMCTPRQLADRDQAFARAERFIQQTVTTAPPPVFRTFQNTEVIRDPKKRTRRVDVEIIRGTAFA